MNRGNDFYSGSDVLDDALNQFGMCLVRDEESQSIEIWPENYQAFLVFQHCVRYLGMVTGGFGGVYWMPVPLFEVNKIMGWLGIKREEQTEVWRRYLIMETEAIEILNSRQT